MYKLFYSPGSAAMAPHALLEELGQPFELVKVDTKSKEHRQPAYLKLNPNGRVPTLVDGDQVIYETAAIMLHLADKHPGSGLAPAVGSAERALYYQWLVYMTNTVQEAYIEYYHPDYYAKTEAGQAEVKAVSEERLQPMFRILDKALEKGPFLLGSKFSAADIFLMMMARWSRNMKRPAATYPNIKRCVDAVMARPATQRMMTAQGLT
jgi:glutathione S-transferase